MAKRRPGEPDRQISPDAENGKLFLIGCLALLVAFLMLTSAVWWFWMR